MPDKPLPVEPRYARLTVQSYKKGWWVCLCDCGNTKLVRGADLRGGKVQSCGCYRRQKSKALCEARATHGMTGTPEYDVWRTMLARCDNPKHKSWADYGERGIRVCPRWRRFENFFADIGLRPAKGFTLERRDNTRGYEPGNCYWATWREQARNRRSVTLHPFNGGLHTITEISELCGVGKTTILYRLSAGYSLERAANPKSCRGRQG